MKSGLFAAACAFFALGFVGCSHVGSRSSKTTVPDDLKDAPAALNTGAAFRGEPLVRAGQARSIPELRVVLFDFDSASLRKSDTPILVENAQWLKAHPEIRVQVTGNTDQRGTIAYNLALGQRRATAVRDFYLRLGVPGDRVATISYGKEKLLCSQAGDECWQRNRRAETLAVAPENIAGAR